MDSGGYCIDYTSAVVSTERPRKTRTSTLESQRSGEKILENPGLLYVLFYDSEIRRASSFMCALLAVHSCEKKMKISLS